MDTCSSVSPTQKQGGQVESTRVVKLSVIVSKIFMGPGVHIPVAHTLPIAIFELSGDQV